MIYSIVLLSQNPSKPVKTPDPNPGKPVPQVWGWGKLGYRYGYPQRYPGVTRANLYLLHSTTRTFLSFYCSTSDSLLFTSMYNYLCISYYLNHNSYSLYIS